jgi:membrane associated rhomboid family serine protease
MFFHDPMGIGHVFFNMLFLFFFGRVVESLIGRRDYLKLYILGGAIAAFSLVPLAWLTGDPRPGLGASGAIYAIGVFAALRIPNLPVILLFVPMPLWVMVTVFMVGGEVLNLVLAGAGIGATVAHLTGAAVGWVYHRRHRARGPGRGASWMARFRKRVEQKRVEQSSASEDEVRARVDRLLEKINAEGIGSLDKAEKDFLQQASRRFQ